MEAGFSERLKELRTDKNMTQGELAQALNLTRPTITYYESGVRSPDAQKLILIADYFGISIDYLLGRTNNRRLWNIKDDALNVVEAFFNLTDEQKESTFARISELRNKKPETRTAAE